MADLLKITHAAGHSRYNTPGKEDPEGMKEWEYTNEIVKLVIEELSHYENVAQLRIDDPTGKVDYSLPKRYNAVNDWNSDVHIDYHLNAYGSGGWTSASGIETFVDPSKPKEAVELANKIQANLVKELGFNDRGVKYTAWDMVHFTKKTSVLVEFAFMTNRNEAMKMRTKEYQQKAAKAVVEALVAQYGLKRRKNSKKVEVVKVAGKEYKDISNAWGKDSIIKAIEKGIIPGYDDKTWKPNEPIKRADIAVILDRLGLLK
jgi:N-acetylmuramoyl-L-alanine amidase